MHSDAGVCTQMATSAGHTIAPSSTSGKGPDAAVDLRVEAHVRPGSGRRRMPGLRVVRRPLSQRELRVAPVRPERSQPPLMLTRIMEFWCKRVHRRAMWPIHGKYICSRCLREYPVCWDSSVASMPTPEQPLRPLVPRVGVAYAEAVPVNGSADSSRYLTRASRSTARKGFSKKCTSVAGMP